MKKMVTFTITKIYDQKRPRIIYSIKTLSMLIAPEVLFEWRLPVPPILKNTSFWRLKLLVAVKPQKVFSLNFLHGSQYFENL